LTYYTLRDDELNKRSLTNPLVKEKVEVTSGSLSKKEMVL